MSCVLNFIRPVPLSVLYIVYLNATSTIHLFTDIEYLCNVKLKWKTLGCSILSTIYCQPLSFSFGLIYKYQISDFITFSTSYNIVVGVQP